MYLAWHRLEVDTELRASLNRSRQSVILPGRLKTAREPIGLLWRLLDENRSAWVFDDVRSLEDLFRLILSHASGGMTNNGDCGL